MNISRISRSGSRSSKSKRISKLYSPETFRKSLLMMLSQSNPKTSPILDQEQMASTSANQQRILRSGSQPLPLQESEAFCGVKRLSP